ncbi:hypothetical protein ACTMTJ_19055 [Phytohabitans sp. LJ34]|uniref:hypothetical protein n=1 Tax=Phytohabitans sp. LJ34 TaxID=3452217 RepID=UPI003F8B3E8A
MGTPRGPRIGPDDAERLLTTGRDAAHPGLSRLLTAAAAAPRPGELAGLRAAVAAFEQAGPAARPTVVPRRRRAVRPLAAAAALAAMLAGGVAVAAETGNLPGGPVTERSTPATGAPPESTRPAPERGPSGTPTAPSPPAERGRTVSPTRPAPTVHGLCQAWEAQRRNPNGAPMAAEAMRDLAAAAGGENRIPAFCATVLARPGTHPPTPSHPGGKAPGKPTPSPAKKG